MLRLQRAAGNQAVQRLRLARFPQTQLTIGRPGDIYEQEAERVAAEVVAPASSPALQPRCACGGTPDPDGECAECRAKRLALQRLGGVPSGAPDVSPELSEGVSSPGQLLDPSSREFFESRLGYDFGEVRIHADAGAADSASALNAQAYTVGRDVVFAAGQYDPDTPAGRRLLAHELAHVVQQGASGERMQRRVADDDVHVTCRPTRPGAVAMLQAAEDAAIELAKDAHEWIQLMLKLYPSQVARTSEDSVFRKIRDMLWRRFHLDMSRRNVREELMPILARRFELVAAWIRRGGARYICGPAGAEPPGDCTTHQGVALAWTASGDDRTQLCDAFWAQQPEEQAADILHEWLHRGFAFLGDCEATNFDNTHCYHAFAQELAVTATPEVRADCCQRPDDPLPPLAGAP